MLFAFLATSCLKKEENSEIAVKNIVVHVICNEKIEEFAIRTQADNLRAALEEKNMISGEKGAYGLFVTTVNGMSADSEKEEWWCFTKGDEPIMTGVDSIKISDGDLFKITLKQGY